MLFENSNMINFNLISLINLTILENTFLKTENISEFSYENSIIDQIQAKNNLKNTYLF
jgi:hypothetical protein